MDRALGRKGLLDVAGGCEVTIGRDYTMDLEDILREKLLG